MWVQTTGKKKLCLLQMKVKMEGTDFLIPFPPDTEIKILQLQINWLHQKRNTCLKGTTIPNLKVEAVDF